MEARIDGISRKLASEEGKSRPTNAVFAEKVARQDACGNASHPVLQAISRRRFLGKATFGALVAGSAMAGFLPFGQKFREALAVWRQFQCDGCVGECLWQYSSCSYQYMHCWFNGTGTSCSAWTWASCARSRTNGCVQAFSPAENISDGCACYQNNCTYCYRPNAADS
jgi:hypothetical protein